MWNWYRWFPPGGGGWRDKAGIILGLPATIRTVWSVLRRVDVFQFRAPTGMGVYLLPAFSLLTGKKGWFKYAGNWIEVRTWSYAWQKWWLSRVNRRPVTINGRWPGQPAHVFSFENPCLDGAERAAGAAAIRSKQYRQPLTACFVGRLDESKGVSRIIDALEQLPTGMIQTMHFVGDGPGRVEYEDRCRLIQVDCRFHGFLNRREVGAVMAAAHLLLLPSESEGFPKVLAEGWNYGCIPVVSDVSAIPQYVNENNGFLWNKGGGTTFAETVALVDRSDHEDLRRKAQRGYELAARFTFEQYVRRILAEILA